MMRMDTPSTRPTVDLPSEWSDPPRTAIAHAAIQAADAALFLKVRALAEDVWDTLYTNGGGPMCKHLLMATIESKVMALLRAEQSLIRQLS